MRSTWRVDHGEREAWRKLLSEALHGTDMSAYGAPFPVTTRMKLEVMRLAPNKRYMMDNDNLAASIKRLQDSLKEAGFLVDDNPRWLESHIVQGISDDKKYWTIVTLSEAEGSKVYSFPVVSVKEEAKRRLEASVQRRMARKSGSPIPQHRRHVGTRRHQRPRLQARQIQ
jgi:hypothetical protein